MVCWFYALRRVLKMLGCLIKRRNVLILLGPRGRDELNPKREERRETRDGKEAETRRGKDKKEGRRESERKRAPNNVFNQANTCATVSSVKEGLAC